MGGGDAVGGKGEGGGGNGGEYHVHSVDGRRQGRLPALRIGQLPVELRRHGLEQEVLAPGVREICVREVCVKSGRLE